MVSAWCIQYFLLSLRQGNQREAGRGQTTASKKAPSTLTFHFKASLNLFPLSSARQKDSINAHISFQGKFESLPSFQCKAERLHQLLHFKASLNLFPLSSARQKDSINSHISFQGATFQCKAQRLHQLSHFISR